MIVIDSTSDEDYALVIDIIGDMLVKMVAHKLTGVVIYKKRKKVVNKVHLKSEIYSFREYMLERNGLNQAILDVLTKRYEVDPEGKDLRSILCKVNEQQDIKGCINLTEGV